MNVSSTYIQCRRLGPLRSPHKVETAKKTLPTVTMMMMTTMTMMIMVTIGNILDCYLFGSGLTTCKEYSVHYGLVFAVRSFAAYAPVLHLQGAVEKAGVILLPAGRNGIDSSLLITLQGFVEWRGNDGLVESRGCDCDEFAAVKMENEALQQLTRYQWKRTCRPRL